MEKETTSFEVLDLLAADPIHNQGEGNKVEDKDCDADETVQMDPHVAIQHPLPLWCLAISIVVS